MHNSVTSQPKQQCVYGYVGSTFDDAIKPILLMYLFGSAVGTTFLAVMFDDGTRPFILSTCLHLIPEAFVWTHLIFPPNVPSATGKGNEDIHRRMRWLIREIYLLGGLVLCLGPVNEDTKKVGPLVTATYLLLAGVSDTLGVWLGLVMMVRRKNRAARRIGISFFFHGAAFHFTVYEYFCEDGNAFGIPALRGFGWVVLLAASFMAFMTVVPLFADKLDLRNQATTAKENWFLVCGVLTSLLVTPSLATGGEPPNFGKILTNPSFLPRDPTVLLAYKIIFPILGLLGSLYIVVTYVNNDLPILPIAATPTTKHHSLVSK